jgi:dipeptidyl aminopeptidase/acylaminoacyl peptidase
MNLSIRSLLPRLGAPLFAALLPVTVGAAESPAASATTAAAVPLIPRATLFGNPERTQARLSPDGKYMSFIAPRDGVLNVWVGPAGDIAAAKPVTNDRKRGIRQHFWAYDGKHVLYLQDQGGDENWRLYSAQADGGGERDLTPLPGVQAQLVDLSYQRPGIALVGINDRDPEWHDVYEIDIATGERRLVERNDQQIAGYLADLELKPRVAVRTLADGGEILRRKGDGWERILAYGQADSLTTQALGIEGDGKSALVLSSVGRDTSALMSVSLADGSTKVIGESSKADVQDVWTDPRTRQPEAYSVNFLRNTYVPLVPEAKKDIETLSKALGGDFEIVSRTLDDTRWVVVTDDPTHGVSSHLYDRGSGKVTKLFDQRPALVGAPLQPMQAIEIRTRDGLTMVSYLTLPPGSDSNGDGRPDQPVPMVLNVHGGPWSRDVFGFDSEHQWLANRGYAVLSVNFRASTGFGKAFVNAGDKQWAAKMHDDLLDAVDWAVREKVTTPDKVAIYGGSYGGYATLVGLTFTPDRFACGVDIVGPSNLNTLLASIPPYWKAFFEDLARRVGDPRTEEGRALLKDRSPLWRADQIKRPLLIAQGANDPRVKQAESDQIVSAMKAKNLPVTYVVYPDEGHGFARPQNRTSFYAISEAFLSTCLGGRFEPVGNDFAGSSLTVPDGANYVPGLSEALLKMPK